MTVAYIKRHGLLFAEACPNTEEGIEDITKKECDVVIYQFLYANPSMPRKARAQYTKTLLSNLDQTDEDIISEFSKSTRYKVNRAERDGDSSSFYSADEVLQNHLADLFCSEYEKMLEEKGMPWIDSKKIIEAYSNADALALSEIRNREGQVLAYHVYVTSQPYSRLLYSVSTFRDVETSELKNAVARANRKLHYDDMRHFRDLGYKYYDWGGIGFEDEVKSIAEFKLGFGGKEADTYTYMEYKTIKGKAYGWMRRLLGKDRM